MTSNHNLPTIYPVTSHTDHVGAGSIFVAITGVKENGIKYIPLAIEKGATTIVIDEQATLDTELLALINKQHIQLIKTTNTRLALAQLAAKAFNYPAQKLTIFAITGTKGKTTSSFILEHLLRSAGHKTALLSTVLNRIDGADYKTTLTTAQPDYLHMFLNHCVTQGITHVVMEVSAQALSLHRVHGILFDNILFTNFDQEHAEFYATQLEYFKEKCTIFNQVKPGGTVIANSRETAGYTISAPHESFDSFKLTTTHNTKNGIGFTARITDTIETFFCPSLVGDYNVRNAFGAVMLAYRSGVPLQTIQSALEQFPSVPGRMERYPLPNGALCIIDHAHNPSSFTALLKTLKELSSRLIVVFGCGGDRDATKRPLMGSIAAENADLVILTTDNPRSEDVNEITKQILSGINKTMLPKVVIELDREKAIKLAYTHADAQTTIALLGKGRDEYQQIGSVKYPFSERTIIQTL